MRFAIYGTGGFGREIVRPALETRENVVFVSDTLSEPIFGVPVISPDELTEDDLAVIAVGDSRVREQIASRLPCRAGFLRGFDTRIGPDVDIGEGSVFCDFTIVTASARIGRHFQCNIYSYVAHDCVIGDFVTFAPRVCCNGNVHIHDHAYIGTGAVIRQGTPGKPLVIGKGAIVGMGAVVTKDVAAGATVIGNPAREKV